MPEASLAMPTMEAVPASPARPFGCKRLNSVGNSRSLSLWRAMTDA
jgi:hypothetical protein